MSYYDKLRDPRWQKMRLKIMERDRFSCRFCYDTESTLNVHHFFYDHGADPWDYPAESLITLCERCHVEFHVSRFGQSIVQALVIGGAGLQELLSVQYAFMGAFEEGPCPMPLPRERWGDVTDAIILALCAVQRGAGSKDIRVALSTVPVGSGSSDA